ncbi:MAG: hypothetical protein GY799_09950 [Desulfobulbaceae bacterium]|nr:hypothetical protein [Desulfobulbaceae bacterium]
MGRNSSLTQGLTSYPEVVEMANHVQMETNYLEVGVWVMEMYLALVVDL